MPGEIVLLMAKKLAAIGELTVAACEQNLGCRLEQDDNNPRKYWGRDLESPISMIDVRIGETGGVVVVTLDQTADLKDYARYVKALGRPVDISIVSPPLQGSGKPPWDRKWSLKHIIDGAVIAFGFEQRGNDELLVSLSRQFSVRGV